MIREAFDWIAERVKANVLEFEDRSYTDRPIHPVKRPLARPIGISTLTGLVDWFNSHEGELVRSGLLIVVESPTVVKVISPLDTKWKERDSFITIEIDPCDFHFNDFMHIENFIISMQVAFEESEAKAKILKHVSHISSNDVIASDDDGISQTVMAKNEIGRLEEVDLKPIQKLKPFSTFREVEQPERQFLLRFRRGADGHLPKVALFSADGTAWELDAVQSIYEHLSDKLGGLPVTIIR